MAFGDRGEFFVDRVSTRDGGEGFIFLSPTLLPILAETPELQADGTFRTVPDIFMQLFTLHITRFGQVNRQLTFQNVVKCILFIRFFVFHRFSPLRSS